MKIITRIVIALNGDILEEESFEYHGPIAHCSGGKSSAPPPPTAAETALTTAQTGLINQQVAQLTKQNEMLDKLWPDISEAMKGQIDLQKLQLTAATNLAPLQEELAKQGIDLQGIQIATAKEQISRNKALEPLILETIGYTKDETGNYVPLPGQGTGVSPLLESQLAKEEKQLGEQLSQKLGPNWQASTPGIQSMDTFKTRADLLRDESARATKTQQMQGLFALSGQGTNVTPLPTSVGSTGLLGGTSGGTSLSSLFSSASPDFSSVQNTLQQNRLQPWLASQGQKAGQTSAMMGGLIGGATVGGTVGGIPGAAIGGVGGLLAGYLLS